MMTIMAKMIRNVIFKIMTIMAKMTRNVIFKMMTAKMLFTIDNVCAIIPDDMVTNNDH